VRVTLQPLTVLKAFDFLSRNLQITSLIILLKKILLTPDKVLKTLGDTVCTCVFFGVIEFFNL
jgi:hypothetical protein